MNRDKQKENFERYKIKKKQILNSKKKLPNTVGKKFFHNFFRRCLWIQRKVNGFTVELLNDIEIPKDNSVIFAVTHIGKWDFEIVSEQIREQFFVVAADYIHMHVNVKGVLLNLNGIVYVDEQDKEDRAATKKLMTKYLKSGKNIMVFPEGTWNLSENEIIWDIAYGTAEAAINANASIVPIAVEQYDRHFVICGGNVINPEELHMEKDSLTRMLRDELATLKWKIWESRGVYAREELAVNYWENFICSRRFEWREYSMKEQVINTYIPRTKKEYWKIQVDLKTGKIPLWYQLVMEEDK